MKAAVLGAGGIIAPAIVRDLAESEEVSDLLLLDRDFERAEATGTTHAPGAEVREADARDGLDRHLENVDVLVNSASYRFNLDVMHACLRSDTNYIDLGGLYHVTGKQLELDQQFIDAGLLALLGMGSAPGKTNVMAARACEMLSEVPALIEISAAGRDLDPPAGPSFPYAVRTLLDELTMAPMAIRDGRHVALEPMLPGRPEFFDEPIGEVATIHTLHSEVRTFGESFGCLNCVFLLALAPAVLDRLLPLLDASDEEIDAVAATAVPASGQTISAHMILASGATRTVAAIATTRPMAEWGLGGSIVSTAAPAAAAVRLMARGKIDATGALPPERCVDPDDLFAELERRNCTFQFIGDA